MILPNMKTLNLVDKDKSDINYHISHYPDGQVNLEIEFFKANWLDPIMIVSRMSSYRDLMIILSANDILRHEGFGRVELFSPYILSCRSDRRFKEYQSHDLKIMSNIINSCKFDKVFIVDQHSDVTSALIDRCTNIDAYEQWIKFSKFDWKNKILVSPDAGAYKKIFPLSEKLGCEIVTGNKVRIDGKPVLVVHGDVEDRDCVIIDDICDGGKTFETLGLKLKTMGAKSVTLFVTHGIFSKGTNLEHIDEIFTTNSYRELEETEKFHVQNIF